MKIVQLLPNLEIGGMERLAVDLAKHQRANGHEPSIFCTVREGPLAKEAREAGVPVRTFGKTDGFSFRLIRDLASALRKERADVLHAHNALVLHYGIMAARLAGVPVVVNTRHGGNLNWDPRREFIWSHSVPRTDGVVFVSEGVRDFFVTRTSISRRNTHVIYNGVDLSKFAGRRANPGRDRSRFRFGVVGRLWPAKDHAGLTRAFGLIAKALPGSELHILGDGPCRKDITEVAASLGITDRVILHGASLDVAGFLCNLDLFVLSSLDEGLPIVMMEAMLAGLPIVSTRLPGLTEVAPEGSVAWYCPAGQPDKLAELMMQAAHSPDLSTMGETAYRLAQSFGIGDACRRYEQVFEQILAKKSRKWPSREAVETACK
jgi:glycosyltransferase involved in cell wall biosynthesis